MMNTLAAYGWNENWQTTWNELERADLRPARVVADFGTSVQIVLPERHQAELSGVMAHHAGRQNVPKVGDWVGVRLLDNGPAIVEVLLPRQSEVARKAAGKRPVKQVIAANVDTAFVLLALDADFSVRRLERYLHQLKISHVAPVVVLNKADKARDVSAYTVQLQMLSVPVCVLSADSGTGLEQLAAHIRPAATIILLGSSGVGKSTLTNQLLGRLAQPTQPIRSSDATGRHTTVHRELFVLPGGGLLIDTPGVREFQLWGVAEGLDDSFEDVAVLAAACKYSTCRHGNEPGCAVRLAIEAGQLDAQRYAAYLKLKAELGGLQASANARAKTANRRPVRPINTMYGDDE